MTRSVFSPFLPPYAYLAYLPVRKTKLDQDQTQLNQVEPPNTVLHGQRDRVSTMADQSSAIARTSKPRHDQT